MKKLLPFILIVAFLCVILSGCNLGGYHEQSGSGSPDVNRPDDPTIGSADAYTVAVYYRNKPFNPGKDYIEVVWQRNGERVTAPLAADGTASIKGLDGDYNISLSGLPARYSYKPNEYSVTADNRHADVIVSDLTYPSQGDGGVSASQDSMKVFPDGGCYVTRRDGIYRVTCRQGQFLYYEFSPSTSGRYSIESLANVYDDAINPIMELRTPYTLRNQITVIDGGGAAISGGYTKNFRYEFSVKPTEVNSCVVFGVSAETKSGEYPVTIDFAITYEGPYDVPDMITETMYATETADLEVVPNHTVRYIEADMGSKLFDGRNYIYDQEAKLYRVYDKIKYADTDGMGPFLCCAIKKSIPCYDIFTTGGNDCLYNADSVGLGSNYLNLSVWSDEYNEFIKKDYTDFIKSYYAAKCNSAGVCYVTEELKQFLQEYAKAHTLWTDGVSAVMGSPEEKGYSATQDDLWLFACGYYDL